MDQKCCKRLGLRVNCTRLLAEYAGVLVCHEVGFADLVEYFRRNCKRQALVSAGDRMTDLIVLPRVEDQQAVGIPERIYTADMSYEGSPIREDEMSDLGTLRRRPMPA